jgi:hypothetical protein
MTRTLRILTVPLLLALALAGCAQNGGDNDNGIATAGGAKATPSASADAGVNLSDDERRLKFAECMREQGIDMPDPGDGPGVRIRVGEGTDPKKVDAAMEACKKYAPNGGEPPKLNAEQLEQARKFAKCMRSNGVPDFPDPGADGRITMQRRAGDGGPSEETVEAAMEKCRQFQPRFQSPGTTR